jgi:hypothetical protein
MLSRDTLVDAGPEKFMDHVLGKDHFDTGGGDRFASSIMGGRRRQQYNLRFGCTLPKQSPRIYTIVEERLH